MNPKQIAELSNIQMEELKKIEDKYTQLINTTDQMPKQAEFSLIMAILRQHDMDEYAGGRGDIRIRPVARALHEWVSAKLTQAYDAGFRDGATDYNKFLVGENNLENALTDWSQAFKGTENDWYGAMLKKYLSLPTGTERSKNV